MRFRAGLFKSVSASVEQASSSLNCRARGESEFKTGLSVRLDLRGRRTPCVGTAS